MWKSICRNVLVMALGLPAVSLAQQTPPPRFSWSPEVMAFVPAEFGEVDSRVRTTLTRMDVGGLWSINDRLQLGLETDAAYGHYHFRRLEKILNVGEPPLRDVFSVKIAPSVIYSLDSKWSLVGGVNVAINGDAEADALDSLTFGGFAGARRQWNDRFALTFGLFATTRIEDDVRVLPLVGVEWQISERWRLESRGPGGRLSYQLFEPLQIFLGMSFDSHDYRLDDASTIPEGVVRDESFPISLGLEWKASPLASVTLQAGNAFGRSLEFADKNGSTLAEADTTGSLFVSLGIRVGFVRDTANGNSKAAAETSSMGGCCKGSVLQFWEENDSVTGTDHNYTQGARITWLAPEMGMDGLPGWARWFGEGIPALGYEVQRVRGGVSVGQSIYTPDDISIAALQPGDRPYAAVLYAAPTLQRRGQTAGGTAVIEELRVDLGWMGPGALGGEAQNFIHRNFKINQAQGWANQLRNEPLGSVSVARAWRLELGGKRDAGAVELIPYVGGTGGTPRTFAAAGSTLRVGVNLPDDFGQPTIRSAMPSTSGDAPSGFGVHLFAGIEGKAIARDSTIDGNLWKTSHRLDAVPWAIEGRLGFAFTWKHVDLGFTYAFETREYTDQDNNHNYGSLWLNWRI